LKIAFWGNFGTLNLGNECTLHAMLAGARQHLPEAELVGVGNNPADTARRHQVAALPNSPDPTLGFLGTARLSKLRRVTAELKDWSRVIGAMRSIDMLVMTGTGMLTDTHDGNFGMPYQMFKWVSAAALCRRKVAFVSVGAEGLSDKVKLFFLGSSLRLARFRSYRDPLSKRRAERLYSGAALDPIYPDLAFSLPESLTGRCQQSPDKIRTVAVGIYAVESGPEAIRNYVEQIGTFVLWLLERGYRTRIVLGDVEYDESVRKQLLAWLESRHVLDRTVHEPVTSFQDLMLQLSEADLVVATRFHNVLLSVILGKPVVSVSHMDKNDELMQAMGLSRYCLPLADVRHEDIVARFQDLEQNVESVRAVVREKAALFRDRLEEQYAILFGLVQEPTT
jgi:polysaccharide pyruvyl transferase WcaK-like protein